MESLSIYSPKYDDLDPINFLDDTHCQEGFNAGYKDILISVKGESGFKDGAELGHIQGCLDVWNSALNIQPNCFSSGIQKKFKKLNELINNGDVQKMRLKFKAIAATLGMKPERRESFDL
ncbi:hypothetical protein MKW98_002913 [Papaver atlanticum]|uniref:Uncharacterized protein n=1 Tax=Papaver atlanticum TaxID=357466 RepID=A0AAD4XVL6_9MAGN|nr:hypothetical protein MKW98_002913 [Papaver atlanticum]